MNERPHLKEVTEKKKKNRNEHEVKRKRHISAISHTFIFVLNWFYDLILSQLGQTAEEFVTGLEGCGG